LAVKLSVGMALLRGLMAPICSSQ